jgi:hypothetical protein
MFNFKGIKAYYSAASLLLLMQMLKMTHFVKSVELASWIGVFFAVGITIKMIFFDKKLREAKYWLFIIWMLIQEVAIGLDQILPIMDYNTVVVCGLLLSMVILYCVDAPSIRKHMDEDAYVLKNTIWLLTVTYAAAVTEILIGYMFPMSPM